MKNRNSWLTCSINKGDFVLFQGYNWYLQRKLIVTQMKDNWYLTKCKHLFIFCLVRLIFIALFCIIKLFYSANTSNVLEMFLITSKSVIMHLNEEEQLVRKTQLLSVCILLWLIQMYLLLNICIDTWYSLDFHILEKERRK